MHLIKKSVTGTPLLGKTLLDNDPCRISFTEGKVSHCNFPVELYELMDRLFGMDKSVNPSATVVDTSNGKCVML
ncbi:hypothetical protein GOP47_0030851 [Adiantum capillus-veneris]|nr:hypothetical protein GOP47_0030851 [Adiantum capillus-veneris]